jgi:predicted transcriptional regulator
LIEVEGRQTIDEICDEIGAVTKQALTIIVNDMRAEHWIKDYTEASGTHTFELTTREEHNLLCQLPPPKSAKQEVVMPCLPYMNKKEDTRYQVSPSVSL